MRSHLPDPIIIHLEKRSLGLSETQVIPGKGQEKTLQNIEPDLVHHLTFQARYLKNSLPFPERNSVEAESGTVGEGEAHMELYVCHKNISF